MTESEIAAAYDRIFGGLHPTPQDAFRAGVVVGESGKAASGVMVAQEPRPLWDANNPRDGYVSDAEWAARKAAKPDTAEARLKQVLDVVQRYLQPDGIDSDAAMAEISGLVDPMPSGVDEHHV